MSVDHSADAYVKTASGDVHVDTVDGSLDVKTVVRRRHRRLGCAATRTSRPSRVTSSSARDDGSVSANTVSGDQAYDAVMQGRVELRAVSGDINVGIRRGSRVFIDANTVSGSTSSEFELSRRARGSSGAGCAARRGVREDRLGRRSHRARRAKQSAELSEQA